MAALPRVARYTNTLHVRAAILEGVLAGVLLTRDVVAKKSFDAGQGSLVVLTMATAACSALAVLLAPTFDTIDRRRLFLVGGVVGRLMLLGVAFVTAPHMLPAFVALNVLMELVQIAVIPAQNLLYQSNYSEEHRGRLFGRASTFQGIATALTALAAGWLLDAFDEGYRFLYPAAGVAGMAACLIFARIKLRRTALALPLYNTSQPAMAPPDSHLGKVWTTVRTVLLEDREFLRFEVAFFLYGTGFMMMQPVIAPFFVDILHLDYSQASLCKGVVFYSAFVVTLPLAGRLTDSIGLPWVAVAGYALLAVFSLGLALLDGYPAALVAFALYGTAMSAVVLCWNLGPTLFARGRSASAYMSLHFSLVGIRALLAFPLGGWLAVTIGIRATFASATVMFLLAILVMSRVARREAARRAALR